MAAITPTVVTQTPLAVKRILVVTATLESASDTITLSLATHGVRTIYSVVPVLEAGQDAALLAGLRASFSGLVITIVSQNEAGVAATDWTGATIRLTCIVD